MTPAEVLRKAADIIQERGLYKGDFYDLDPRTGPCCAIGAMRAACHGGDAFIPLNADGDAAHRELASNLRQEHGFHVRPVARWNDAKGRTKRQVVAKLRAVAKKLETGK